jgi:hypothetical protein
MFVSGDHTTMATRSDVNRAPYRLGLGIDSRPDFPQSDQLKARNSSLSAAAKRRVWESPLVSSVCYR